MRKENFARALLGLIIFGLLLCLVYADNKSKKDFEVSAAARSVNSTQYDTTPLPVWDEAPKSSVRMIYGNYSAENEIATDDGNLWEVNTERIQPEETLLVWFDTKNTPEIEDDAIIKIWKGVYD